MILILLLKPPSRLVCRGLSGVGEGVGLEFCGEGDDIGLMPPPMARENQLFQAARAAPPGSLPLKLLEVVGGHQGVVGGDQFEQMDRLVLERAPQPLNENIVHPALAAVHGDFLDIFVVPRRPQHYPGLEFRHEPVRRPHRVSFRQLAECT